MDIEEVARDTPEKIFALSVHPAAGLQPYQCRDLAFALGLADQAVRDLQALLIALYRLYHGMRCEPH